MFIKSVSRANLGKIFSFGKKILGEGGNRYKSIAQKFLAVGVSFSLAAAMVPLGKSHFVAEAAVTRSEVAGALTVDSSTSENDGTNTSAWYLNSDVYESTNVDTEDSTCTMTVDVDVTAPYAELEFEWKVSGFTGYDFLSYELTAEDSTSSWENNVVASDLRSGADEAFITKKIGLPEGNYTLSFTYTKDLYGKVYDDKGYVKNIKLSALSGVTAVPVQMFATPADLLKLSEETDDGAGLLATGSDSDKVVKINFGARDNDVKYYYEDWKTERTATAGALTWLIAGSDDTNSVVLYSEEPIMSANRLKHGGDPEVAGTDDSRFQTSVDGQKYQAPANSGYGQIEVEMDVNANHWGQSNLRDQMAGLSTSLFTTDERPLVLESTITTKDPANNVDYTTNDYLYAPLSQKNYLGAKRIAVGATDGLLIDEAYWGGCSWVRSPLLDRADQALCVLPAVCVDRRDVDVNSLAVSAAFRLNLASVLFSSSALAVSAAGSDNFSQILPNSPMALRMNGTVAGAPLENSTIAADGQTLTYTAPARSRLMAIITTDNGATYQYTNAIGTDVIDATFDFSSITELSGQRYAAKAWIEADMVNGGTLTYATAPVDVTVSQAQRPAFWETTVDWNGVPQKIRLYDDNNVLPDGAKFSASLVDTHPDIDHDHPAEHTLSYELLLADADGNPIQLSDRVRLMFEVVDGLDVDELEIIRVTLGDDVEFDESYVTLDGKTWVQVETDHFSPYALIDKLTAADKADSNFVPTGDEVTYLTISSLGLIMTLALGLMFKTNFGKRKFDE